MWLTVLHHCTAFVVGAALDFAWARWMRAVASHRPAAASGWAGFLGLLSVSGTLSVVRGLSLAAAYVLGLAVGSWFAARLPTKSR